MFPVIKPTFVLGLFVIVVFMFHCGHVASSKLDESQDEAIIENKALLAQDQEDPEANIEASNTIEKRKIRIRISCRCWIGWRGRQSSKYRYFGVIRKFRWYELRKQSRCSASCSNTCAPYLTKTKTNYDYLCKKIGKNYNYKTHKVGCFSRVGGFDFPSNLWDFDGSPHKLCCKLFRRNCKSVHGWGFYWHYGLRLCVKYLSPGCIPGVPNGYKKPPVCCYGNKVYACQKAEYIVRSKKC